jgi:hypothetical protein
MKERDAKLKSGVLAFFSNQGLPAEEIPCLGGGKTPDILLCKGEPDETLLEIKQKEDDEDEIRDLEADLANGGIFSRSKSLSSWNRADSVIRSSIRQIKAVDPDRKALHVFISTKAPSSGDDTTSMQLLSPPRVKPN